MVDTKSIGICAVITAVLGIVLLYTGFALTLWVLGAVSALLGGLVATMVVKTADMQAAAIDGLIGGAVGGILISIIMSFVLTSLYGGGAAASLLGGFILQTTIVPLAIMGIVGGAIGGVIGVSISKKK